jgi:hypothetical protein
VGRRRSALVDERGERIAEAEGEQAARLGDALRALALEDLLHLLELSLVGLCLPERSEDRASARSLSASGPWSKQLVCRRQWIGKSAVTGNGAVYSKTTRFGGSNSVIVHGIAISLRTIFRVSAPVVACARSPS